MKEIAVYGAGDFGQKMYAFLQDIGNAPKMFVQSSEPNLKECNGVPIISVEEYLKRNYEFLIFIAINDSGVVNSIYELFEKHGYDRKRIFDCRSFVVENAIGRVSVVAGDKICNLCGRRLDQFLPTGVQTELFSELRVIGGGYRENAVCPYCNSLDRNRWVYWVLKEKTDIFDAERTVLHFAPEEMIQKKLQGRENCDYYAGDLVLKPGNHKIDVTKIPFQDNFFDYILINHVLEHVKNEGQAFDELWRVMKTDGRLVLSFPITLEIETVEKEGICCDDERLKYYGQKDHVRLYGKDFQKRIEDRGWHVQRYTPEEVIDMGQIKKFGFLKNDILLICSKK